MFADVVRRIWSSLGFWLWGLPGGFRGSADGPWSQETLTRPLLLTLASLQPPSLTYFACAAVSDEFGALWIRSSSSFARHIVVHCVPEAVYVSIDIRGVLACSCSICCGGRS